MTTRCYRLCGRHRRTASGLTMLELLIVVAVIGILIAMLLPAVQAARENARRHSCANHLAQLMTAVQHYETVHRVYPPGSVNNTGPIDNRALGYHMGWLVQILPYIEQQNAYERVDFTKGVYDRANAVVRAHTFDSLTCPSSWVSPNMGLEVSHYAAVHHDVEAPIDSDNHGTFFLNSSLAYDDIADGHGTTLFLGEKIPHPTTDLGWMSGSRATLRNTGWAINHELKLDGGSGAWRSVQVDPWQAIQDANDAASDSGELGDTDAGADDQATTGDMLAKQENGQSAADDVPDSANPLTEAADTSSTPPATSAAEDTAVAETTGETSGEAASAGEQVLAEGDDSDVYDSMGYPYDYMMAPPGGTLPLLPNKPQMLVGGFASLHVGGANFVVGDGAVRYLAEQIDMRVYQQLGHRADGQVIDSDDW
ncbi:MAG: DUF1559 domain-containing protein [Planctomycetales bacterium]|nr:DUF1559 domain-containing protein [Planctomycetales bacterium]